MSSPTPAHIEKLHFYGHLLLSLSLSLSPSLSLHSSLQVTRILSKLQPPSTVHLHLDFAITIFIYTIQRFSCDMQRKRDDEETWFVKNGFLVQVS
ncbi:hypothetical protein ACOSQ4_006280 [Xanthoceras sorbifolium]